MCVCASINPGSTVAFDRSTTCAPAGTSRVGANASDLVALNHDGLIGERLAGLHVQQMSGVDDHRLRRRRGAACAQEKLIQKSEEDRTPTEYG